MYGGNSSPTVTVNLDTPHICNCEPDTRPRRCGNCNGFSSPPAAGLSIVIQGKSKTGLEVKWKEYIDLHPIIPDSGEHCHDDEQQHRIDQVARRKLWIASVLCVFFMVGEAIGESLWNFFYENPYSKSFVSFPGGILAGSLAVATDAAHLLTDFAGFMISLFALYVSARPATKRLSYGYHRAGKETLRTYFDRSALLMTINVPFWAEVIGALTSVLMIWVVTGILVYLAVQRVVLQEFEIDAPIMLITSGIGLVVNIMWV